MMIDDDNDGQIIFGDLVGLKLPVICLTGEEKPRKNLIQGPCPDRGSNPGPQRWTLRAVNLRDGAHGFTSLPKEVILMIFTL